MKYLMCFYIAVVTLSVTLPSTAFATYATSPAGTTYTGMLQGTSEGYVVFQNAIAAIECEAAVEGVIESHGSQVTGKGKSTKWEYVTCKEPWAVDSVTTGTIEIHSTGNGIGTITSTGTKGIATHLGLGLSCIYETHNTDLGVITDSSLTGGKATLHLSGSIPRVGGSFLCGGSTTTYKGSAVVNTPKEIFID